MDEEHEEDEEKQWNGKEHMLCDDGESVRRLNVGIYDILLGGRFPMSALIATCLI